MIRRLSSRSLLVSPASSSSSSPAVHVHVAAARCSYSDSIDDSGNGRSATCTSLSSSSSSSSSSSAAGRLMCDTAEGVYTQMMMRTFAASANANMNANAAAADVPCGGGSTCKLRPQRASPSATSSIFGDSPAAVATSLMGCFFFGTTYGYYIGGAVKDAAMSKFGGGQDE